MQDSENTCPECGEFKREEYEFCYNCKMRKAAENDELCECGNFKNPNYPQCFQCSQE